MARIRRERPVLLAAILSALAALAAGMNKWVVLGLLLIMIVTALFNEAPVIKDAPAEPLEIAPEAPPRRLPEVSSTLSGLDIPVMVLSDDASVLFQNRAAEKAFGEVVLGAHISARLRSPGVLDMVRETIATNAPNQIEHAERLPSERVYIVRSAPVEFAAEGARERYFILSFRDISEVRRIDRMRSDFVANASHELRTPLASLRGFIETIQGPAKNDLKAQARFLAIMFDQATRMSRLVDDLLSLSRLELKSHIAPDEKVDLVPLLGHVRDSLVPLAADVGVDINLHLPEGKVEVLGDRDELVQVFENLMENACKYGQEGKIVDVWLKNGTGNPVEVSIVDKGPGIPAEHVPRLTERFYRVSIEDSRSKKGTGLGLAIVKHILTRHRARLIVKSEVDKGTDFTVRF
ncbi:phosphate regulon sensor histidine kinase PhoR [Rhizobium hidalgonense]|uniref:histidine kinase n=1 Tax=Rhizobium hidalgonense TaxID=1538159 RepID=A0A2A6K4T8_9HYPH|nr:phosphate regulon sensor histidine kinase PhoR [Rhizobium hidalgonense]MDR9776754.1 phosphate regulon sensor histidine kinase PhoR [Rhizobium hidalgonense]MDR9814706.1 phosphate regulon sensor histidine kinase PhoR [Rhizobium hidalgonense]MDR9823290.1 phosphate regulon sensor histidine kinase PhoR [Rhizobium hidalgonense]PDT19568.1 phosphate regulon sensor histidine kinase PhoR [Rhizobium hidalgonense]PON05153.1 two-component sensor histidine kinase [Rhizobium hidalgonense]